MRQNREGGHSTTGDGLHGLKFWSDEHGAKPATDSMPAHISAGNMNERGRERTAAGLGTVGRRWAGGGGRGEGGLSPYFNSSLIRVLAAKDLPCSGPTPIHITLVLLHPWSIYPLVSVSVCLLAKCPGDTSYASAHGGSFGLVVKMLD